MTKTSRPSSRPGRTFEVFKHRGVYPPLTPWSKFPPPYLPLPFPPFPLEVGPLIVARGSGGAVFGEFHAKNLASSSNDLQELFRK